MEINVITHGDSSKPSTWSNVPYCITAALQQLGCQVNRIDVSVEALGAKWRVFSVIWNGVLRRFFRWFLFGKRFSCWFDWSPIYFYLAEQKLQMDLSRYPNANVNLWLSLDFKDKWTSNLNILFHDWSREVYICEQCKCKPDIYELLYLFPRENEAISNADSVFIMFRKYADFIQKRSNKQNVHFIGENAINNINEESLLEENEIVGKKISSHIILFVGRRKYLKSASELLSAFKEIKSIYSNAELHFIGLESYDFYEPLFNGVNFHGWLDKGKADERSKYYKLMQSASVFVNCSEVWGGYSSTLEAMYYYTPVILFPYSEFVEEFGKKIDFGLYSEQNNATSIKTKILYLFANRLKHEKMCINAHKIVKNRTWTHYVEKMLKISMNKSTQTTK